MQMNTTNPAALEGWIKSFDAKSGRYFFANHVTRRTQWEPPEGWREEETFTGQQGTSVNVSDEENDPLPSNWEEMHDPSTGKPFYVDHERKITTWTRPRADKPQASMSLRPATAASPSSGNSAALARVLQQQKQQTNVDRNSYHQEASYYQTLTTQSIDVDFSDSLPKLDFLVKKVPDSLRPSCPGCGNVFTISKRRHHCRLCGDVFCDTCSNHRCNLPLEGPEFEKPVRVCDFCFKDVDVGNFFSMRRYLTVLHLYKPAAEQKSDDEAGVATIGNVNAALSALCQDLQQMVQAGDTNLHEKVTIPPDLLLPEILKHMKQRETADRAVCCIAALVALESLAGDQKADFTTAIYIYGKKDALNDILGLLERNSKDRRSLYVQEQAARTLYYLTESRVIAATTRKLSELTEDESYGNPDDCLDISRALRVMVDHTSTTSNSNLQRWATASIKNLLVEDQRRATMSINNMAAIVASGLDLEKKLEYESCLEELVSTGGLMILGSLIGADDADIRAHAVAALGAALTSTRTVDASMIALSEMTNSEFGRTTSKDGDIVRAIIAAGGCGSSVSQLLLSAENSVAGMGCSLVSSLVLPLLSDPTAGSVPNQYDYRRDQTGSMGACREASVEIATGTCLPALLTLVQEQGASRPLELRAMAMVTLAAVVSSVGAMGCSWAQGAYEEGLELAGAPSKLKEAILMINDEGVVDIAIEILQSGSNQSLGSANDTPSSRIRESAGIVVGSLTACSAEAIIAVQSKNVLSKLLVASTDPGMTVPSTLRGDGAPRCLGVLETVAAVFMFAWQHPSGASNELLDKLIELIDAGAIPYASRVLNIKIDWDSVDKVGSMKGRSAACKLLSCLFGVALTSVADIGMRRLNEAVDLDSRSYRSNSDGKRGVPSNVIEASLGCLQAAAFQARKILMGAVNHGHHYQAALLELVENSLLAVGSMSGSSIAPGGSEGTLVTRENFLVSRNDPYVGRRQEICSIACDIVVRDTRNGPVLLPTMIVGGFGEGSVLASVRLALAIAQNGSKEQHAKLAMSGVLVPISDLLRSALSGGNIYKFSSSLALIQFCGPYVTAGQGGGLESVRDAIRVATNVLVLPINPDATLKQLETQETLNAECIATLDALSRNSSLWSSISKDALPAIVCYLNSSTAGTLSDKSRGYETKCSALRAVLQIVQLPSGLLSTAESDIADPLCKFLITDPLNDDDCKIHLLSMRILHVVAMNHEACRKARLLHVDHIRSICALLGKTTLEGRESKVLEELTFLGLEILHAILRECGNNIPTTVFLQSDSARTFLEGTFDPNMIRALCSTILNSAKASAVNDNVNQVNEESFALSRLYGPSLMLTHEGKCAGFQSVLSAAENLFFNVSVLACAIESASSDRFWQTLCLQEIDRQANANEVRASTTLVAHYLSLLANRESFSPLDSSKSNDFLLIMRPLVRHHLLTQIKESIMQHAEEENEYGIIPLLVSFRVPQMCLLLWREPALLDLAIDVVKAIVEHDPEDVIHLFVEDKTTLLTVFDLLNAESTLVASSRMVEMRRFLAGVLRQLAESGLLKDAVERFDVRSNAIAALAAACLDEEECAPDEDEDIAASKLSSVLMGCLVDLCSVKSDGSSEAIRIVLSQNESRAIATRLGKKLCHMVLCRFLERTKLQQYKMDDDNDILNTPEVAMLCAIAQHDDALQLLRKIGGLNALGLVAGEGEASALVALKQACQSDVEILLEGDTYISIMSLLTKKRDSRNGDGGLAEQDKLQRYSFELIGHLCARSAKGRVAVAATESCQDCLDIAAGIVSSVRSDIDTTVSTLDPLANGDGLLLNDDGESCLSRALPTGVSVPLDSSVLNDMTVESAELCCAACYFLSGLVATSNGRNALLGNNTSISALALLAVEANRTDLQLASLNLLVSLASFITEESNLSASIVAKVAISVLTSENKIDLSSAAKANLLACAAVNGVLVVLDLLSESEQKELSHLFAATFVRCIRNLVAPKAKAKVDDSEVSAQLVYGLSLTLFVIRGKTFADEIFSHELIAACVHLIQWRLDPKTTIGNVDQNGWDGCVTHCLILISILLCRPLHSLKSSGIDLEVLISTPLMLTRTGKAPRKAIDLRSALELIVSGNDSAAALSAMRLLGILYSK